MSAPPLRNPATLPPAIIVRPLVAGDLPGLSVLLHGLDDRARYRRWFSGAADVDAATQWASHPEDQHAVGLVAVTQSDEIVGHAALIPIDSSRAEVGFEIAAPWRHQGVASGLLAELEHHAVQRGLRILVAEVLAENRDMLAVMREHGPCQERRDGNVVELELEVAPVSREDTHGTAALGSMGSTDDVVSTARKP
jgi:RimJ/RimL family protein N-acetyltransferase